MVGSGPPIGSVSVAESLAGREKAIVERHRSCPYGFLESRNEELVGNEQGAKSDNGEKDCILK